MFLTHRRRWKLSDSISLAPLSRWLGGGASKSSSKASTLQQSLPLATSRGSSSPRSKSVMAALALATALAANQVRAVGAFAPQLVPSAKVSSLLSSSRSPGSASPTAPSAAWDILGARDGRQQRPTPALARRGMCLRASAAADVRSATLGELALRVLTEGDSKKKVALSNEAVDLWQSGEGSGIVGSVTPPDRPERPHDVETVDWTKIQKRKPDADGQRITLLHAIAHIESYAMDLSWDIVARFKGMPKEFYDDWVQVAKEETLHFSLLSDRLEQLGSSYGAMPVHDGLWSAAALTKDDIRGSELPTINRATHPSFPLVESGRSSSLWNLTSARLHPQRAPSTRASENAFAICP
jgi:hypothetical protein